MKRSGELLELKVCADGFLYNMVRAITGTVLYAAEGKFLPEDIPAILESRDRTLAGPTVPPGGLYLTRLWYEDEAAQWLKIRQKTFGMTMTEPRNRRKSGVCCGSS